MGVTNRESVSSALSDEKDEHWVSVKEKRKRDIKKMNMRPYHIILLALHFKNEEQQKKKGKVT